MNDPKVHDTFANEVEKSFLEMGQAKYSEQVKAIKGKDYYYDHVSQINLQRETLNGVGYDAIKKQIISEVDFVMRDL